jgi:hypothetical protein
MLYDEEPNTADGPFSSKPIRALVLRAVCVVARLANMRRLFVAPRFAHPIPQSQCATLRDLFRGSLTKGDVAVVLAKPWKA